MNRTLLLKFLLTRLQSRITRVPVLAIQASHIEQTITPPSPSPAPPPLAILYVGVPSHGEVLKVWEGGSPSTGPIRREEGSYRQELRRRNHWTPVWTCARGWNRQVPPKGTS